MLNIFLNILVQGMYFIGFVYLVGYLISLINRGFYNLTGQKMWVCYATGFLGTPIHELSHALMCVVFRHKIDEIKLFQIDTESGTLGYVSHSYNPRNIYHVIGNYFIGVAPIAGGAAVVFIMLRFMIPESFVTITNYLNDFAASQTGNFGFEFIGNAFSAFFGILGAIFSGISAGWIWWLFLVLAMCIALHICLSPADIKGTLGALPFLIGFIVVVNLLVGLISDAGYVAMTQFMNVIGGYIVGFLIVALTLSMMCLIVAIVIKLMTMIPRLIFK